MLSRDSIVRSASPFFVVAILLLGCAHGQGDSVPPCPVPNHLVAGEIDAIVSSGAFPGTLYWIGEVYRYCMAMGDEGEW